MAGARNLGSLTLDMILNVGQFEAGMNRAERAVDNLEKNQKKKAASDDRFIKSMEAYAAAVGKTKVELFELEAAQRGVAERAAPLAAEIRKQEKAFTDLAEAKKKDASNNSFIALLNQEVAALKDQASGIVRAKSEILALTAAEKGLTDVVAPQIAALKQQEQQILANAAAAKKLAAETSLQEKFERVATDLSRTQALGGRAPTRVEQLGYDTAAVGGVEAVQRMAPVLKALRDQERAIEAVAEAERKAASQKDFLTKLDQEALTANKTKKELLELQAVQLGIDSKVSGPKIAQVIQNDQIASNKALIDSINQRAAAIGKSNIDLLEQKAIQAGILPQVAAQIAALRKEEDSYVQLTKQVNKYGMTAAAVRAAQRNVPAQLTDIFVGLSTGQNPLTVLLQQGGQLKDMFGGLKPAAEALGSIVLRALLSPFTLLAGVLAAVGYGLIAGKNEFNEYRKSILDTGNAAGTTVGQLDQISKRLAATGSGVSQGDAAEAVAALAATGKVAYAQLAQATEAVTLRQKFMGVEAKNTVKEFAELGKEPVEASKKLNEQYNYLTSATYSQIKALKEAGREAEAAALAQKSFGDAQIERSKEMEKNLGYLERGWNAVTDAIKKAGSALRSIGREDTVDEQVKKMGDAMAAADRLRQRNPLVGPIASSNLPKNQEFDDQVRQAQMKQGADLRLADFRAQQAQVQKEGIAANDKIDQISKSVRKKTEQLDDELKSYRKELDKLRAAGDFGNARLDPKKIAAEEANIREKFKERGNKGPKDDDTKKNLDNQLKDLDRAIKAEDDLLNQRNKFLDFYNQQGLISIKDYYDAKDTIQSEAVVQQRARLQEELDIVKKQIAATPVKGNKVNLAELRGKENEIIDKQIKLEQDNAFKTVYAAAEKIKAQKAYQDSLKDVQAQLAEMNQDLAKAAGIRFDLANEGKVKQFTAEGNPQALADLARLREYGQAQAEINALQAKFSLAQGDLQIQTERFDLAYKRGLLGETEYYTKIGEANKRAYDTTSAQIANFDKLKQSMTLTPEQLQQYDRLKLQLEQLGASLDPLADKFNTLFDDSLGNFFADIGSGTKTAKDAFKDMFKTFSNEILKISGKDLAAQFRKAFGGEGGFDIGKSISDTFKSGNGNNIFEDVKKLFSGGSSGTSGGGIGGFFDSIKKSLGLGDAAKSLSTAADSWDFGAAKSVSTSADSWDFGAAAKTGESGIMSLFKDGSAAASMTALGTSAITASTSILSMSVAASAAASALATVAASSAASSIGSAFSGSGFGTGSLFGNQDYGQFFDSGGFTGTGNRLQPAGIVHKGEYVMDANTTRRLGLNTLDALSRGASPGGGGTSVVQNINVLPGATRETGYQAARASTRELIRSSGR